MIDRPDNKMNILTHSQCPISPRSAPLRCFEETFVCRQEENTELRHGNFFIAHVRDPNGILDIPLHDIENATGSSPIVSHRSCFHGKLLPGTKADEWFLEKENGNKMKIFKETN